LVKESSLECNGKEFEKILQGFSVYLVELKSLFWGGLLYLMRAI